LKIGLWAKKPKKMFFGGKELRDRFFCGAFAEAISAEKTLRLITGA
jgi:hypothetical protein